MFSFKHEVFLEVARQLSFTKASQALYISQPAITKHIQQLEEQYKTSLFERKGSSITLSEAGKVLFEYLLKAKAIEKQLAYEIGTLGDLQHVKGDLKLGASTTVALYIVPAILSGFRVKYPDVRMSLLNRNSENILKALLEHEIDLGIIEAKTKMPHISSQLFMADEVIPVCSAKSYIAKKGKLLIEELKDIPVVLRERGSGTLTAVKQALASHNIKLSDLQISMRLGGTEALKNFVLADDSLGFLPMRAVTKEIAAGELVRIYIEGFTVVRQFYFVQRQGENDGLNNAFIKFSKSHYNIKL
ncbi:transcriptional regulator [Cytophagales bacterium WSM2-2]|nr:transcriptional regulator [Cytophagales bacterium WSM2-2]